MIVTTDDTNYKNIANAIRSKTGKTDKILPSLMSSEIESIQSGGSDLVIDDASYLFAYGSRLNSLNELLSVCKGVTNCQSMFERCLTLNSIDMSSFDTSKVTIMYNMFNTCTRLTSLNLSGFDTSQTTNMTQMFSACENLKKLDISSFSSEKLAASGQMFARSGIETLIIDNPILFQIKTDNCFNNTPIASGTGFVYVPDAMVETYKSATNWSVYADQIKPISELPAEEA